LVFWTRGKLSSITIVVDYDFGVDHDDEVNIFVLSGYPTFDVGSNYWNFTYSQYSTAPIPASVFAVPTGAVCHSCFS
jgi:hypothetical protein